MSRHSHAVCLCGGAPQPALGPLGKARGEGGSWRELYSDPAWTSLLPGLWTEFSGALSPILGEGWSLLAPGATVTAADCPQCVPTVTCTSLFMWKEISTAGAEGNIL